MFRITTLSLITLALIGCKSDPYSDIETAKPGEEVVTQQELQGPAPKPADIKDLLGISAEDSHVINEGETLRIPFKVAVDEGEAVLRLEGLETLPGSYYEEDEEGNQYVVWKPSFDAANDPTGVDPTVDSRFYSFNIVITSTIKSNISRIRTIGITVNNYRRPLKIVPKQAVTGNFINMKEGSTLEATFDIEDADFPNGPFEFYSDSFDFPAVITPVANNSKSFKLTMQPGYDAVKLTGNGASCRGPYKCTIKIPKTFYVRSPDGYISTKELELRLDDIRQDPVVVVPDSIWQAGEVSFNIDVIDPNGEITPTLTLLNPNTTYGSNPKLVQIKEAADENAYRESKVLKWEDITQEFEGKFENLRFQACVLKNTEDTTQCVTKRVTVNFDKRARRAPVITRDAWNFEDVIYLKRYQSKSVKLPITTLDADDEIVSVEITRNKNSTSKVEWRNGFLEIESRVNGLQYFTLKATTKFGMTSTESFVFEGLPQDWEKNLYIGESQNDSDLVALKKASSSIKIVNPEIMTLDDRLYEERELLVVGTSLLKDQKLSEKLVEMSKRVKNILIMSPELKNLPKEILDELEKYYVFLDGKLSEQQNAGNLASLKLVTPPAIDLKKPAGDVKLGGTLTSSSNDPMSIYVDDLAIGTCSPLFSLFKPGQKSTSIGVQCKRANGGLMTVLGFEPGDIKTTDSADVNIATDWLKTLMSGQSLVLLVQDEE